MKRYSWEWLNNERKRANDALANREMSYDDWLKATQRTTFASDDFSEFLKSAAMLIRQIREPVAARRMIAMLPLLEMEPKALLRFEDVEFFVYSRED